MSYFDVFDQREYWANYGKEMTTLTFTGGEVFTFEENPNRVGFIVFPDSVASVVVRPKFDWPTTDIGFIADPFTSSIAYVAFFWPAAGPLVGGAWEVTDNGSGAFNAYVVEYFVRNPIGAREPEQSYLKEMQNRQSSQVIQNAITNLTSNGDAYDFRRTVIASFQVAAGDNLQPTDIGKLYGEPGSDDSAG